MSGPADAVTLVYRLGYGDDVEVAMTGSGAGDYSATIPQADLAPGVLVRWYVTAQTPGGATLRDPEAANTTSDPQYFGTIVADTTDQTVLPLFEL